MFKFIINNFPRQLLIDIMVFSTKDFNIPVLCIYTDQYLNNIDPIEKKNYTKLKHTQSNKNFKFKKCYIFRLG